MKHRCAINLHNLTTVAQDKIGKRLATLSEARAEQVCTALAFALGCL